MSDSTMPDPTVIKVLNLFTIDKNEPNRGWVVKDQTIEPGIYQDDEIGHFAVAEAQPTGNNPLTHWDQAVYTPAYR